MNQAQVDRFPTVIFSQKHQVLVGPPDDFFGVALCLLNAFGELLFLCVIQTKVVSFIGYVFPGKHLPGIVVNCPCRIGNAP